MKIFNFKPRKIRGFEILPAYQKLFDYENIRMPIRSTSEAAGHDICAIGTYAIPPNGKVVIDTGLTAYMKKDEWLALFVRSGLSFNYDMTLQNAVGVIDADFYGKHIRIMLRNESTETVYILQGDRIAQGVFMNYLKTDDDAFVKKSKRIGGFGSTGVATA